MAVTGAIVGQLAVAIQATEINTTTVKTTEIKMATINMTTTIKMDISIKM